LVRTAVRALAARAVDRADKGDIDGAKEDLLAIHRLAQLLCQEKTFIAYLVAITLDSTASRTEQGIAANVKLTALQARSLLSQTYGLGPMPLPVDAYDWGERLIVLDAAMLIAREGYEGYLRRVERDMGVIFEKAFPASSTSRETVELPKFDLDIDEYLRAMNEGCDEVVRCAKLKDFAACTAAFAEMDKDKMPEAREAEKAFPGMASGQVDPLLARKRVKLLVEKIGTGDPKKLARALVGFDLWEWMEGSHSGRVFELGVEARAQHALSVISLAMAAYRAEKGEYPDSLDKLAPTCLKTIPLDPFTDKPMRYKRTDKGYVLYSVGPNMRDDGGVRDYAASAPADRKDDISVNNEK